MAIIIFFVTSGTEMLKNPIDVFILEKGAISYEEATERIYNTRRKGISRGKLPKWNGSNCFRK